MKNLHKKISAVLLAGAIVMGGSLSSAHAVSFLVSGVSSSVEDFAIFAKEEGIRIVKASEKEEKINEWIKKEVKLKGLRSRLLKSAKEIKDMKEYEELLKSGKEMHKIKVKGMCYLIRLDEASIYAASNPSEIQFYNRKNQRNFDIVRHLGKKYGFEIVMVADSSSWAESVEMNANIRSEFKKQQGIMDKLLKGPEIRRGDAESLRGELKSGKNPFKSQGYHRVQIGNLDYVIYKK